MQGESESVGSSGTPKTATPSKGLDLSADLVRQVITLSTAVTAFTATFAKNFLPSTGGITSIPNALRFSWVFVIIAVFFGIVTLMTIVGAANRIEAGQPSLGANATNIRIFGVLTMVAFFIGLVLTIKASLSIVH
jgi:hypothetical protein